MHRRTVLKTLVSAGTAAATGSWGSRAHAITSAKLAVIVGASSPLKELSSFQLKQIYLGTMERSPAGGEIVPFNHVPKSDGRVAFDQRVLGMSPEAAARYWIDRRIRGERGPPRTVPNIDLLQRVVERLDQSIGYAYADQVRPGLRVLRIDGRLPDDNGYPLLNTSSEAQS